MSDVAQACTDLAAWLPAAAELITEPDTHGTPVRSEPQSKPPWNAAIANAVYDVHAAVRAIEQDLRSTVTGTLLRRGGSDANTLKAIDAIRNLAQAADAEDDVAAMLGRLLTPILQHPAVDLEEPPQRPAVACPRCQRRMLRYRPRSGELACLGCQRKAALSTGRVSGEPLLEWDDGEVTIAPEGTIT